jgi:3'(2'), 5'-bisphosphate nucleotidase
VDFAAQALINTMIRHAFPDDAIIAEEDAASIRGESSKILRDRIVEMANKALTEELESGDDPAWGIGPGKNRTTDELLDAIDSGNHPGGPTGREWFCSFRYR